MLIRPANEADAIFISRIYKYYVLNKSITFETEPPTKEDFQKKIESSKYPWLVAVENEEVKGYAYASKHREREAYRWSVDFGVYVDKDFHQKGIGKMLYQQLKRITAELGYFNAYAGIALPNEKSIRLHETIGFKKIGVYENVGFKLGKWHSVSWWHLQLNEYPNSPSEPRAVNSIEYEKLFR
jgi:L-amino acid N-acyltransferase YncA